MTIIVNLRDIILWSIVGLAGLVLVVAWIIDVWNRRGRRP